MCAHFKLKCCSWPGFAEFPIKAKQPSSKGFVSRTVPADIAQLCRCGMNRGARLSAARLGLGFTAVVGLAGAVGKQQSVPRPVDRPGRRHGAGRRARWRCGEGGLRGGKMGAAAVWVRPTSKAACSVHRGRGVTPVLFGGLIQHFKACGYSQRLGELIIFFYLVTQSEINVEVPQSWITHSYITVSLISDQYVTWWPCPKASLVSTERKRTKKKFIMCRNTFQTYRKPVAFILLALS